MPMFAGQVVKPLSNISCAMFSAERIFYLFPKVTLSHITTGRMALAPSELTSSHRACVALDRVEQVR